MRCPALTIRREAIFHFDNRTIVVVEFAGHYTLLKRLTEGFEQEGVSMKVIMLIGLLAGSMFFGAGCGTPGYSTDERFAQIGRNWNYEGGQLTDDIDHVLLLRPASRLTVWNVQ